MHTLFYYLTTLIRRLSGGKCGKKLRVHGTITIVGKLGNLRLGNNVSLNHYALLNCRDIISIGDNSTVSAGCQIQTAYLKKDDMFSHASAPIIIGKNSWIAAGSIVTAGCVIGDGVVLGALSLAKGTLADYSLYVGSPAIKKHSLR
jgi:acetyltransferase-like isoleucine patch superfamily enzyme